MTKANLHSLAVWTTQPSSLLYLLALVELAAQRGEHKLGQAHKPRDPWSRLQKRQRKLLDIHIRSQRFALPLSVKRFQCS